MTAGEIVLVAGIGLMGGMFGGLLGIGGSIVMIPLLTLTLGPSQQLYQAACMIVNVVVAVGAVRRHARAGSVRWDCLRFMLPAAVIAILVGVGIGNELPGRWLQRIFGIFLAYVAVTEAWRLVRPSPRDEEPEMRLPPGMSVSIGSATGLLAGLLGIGGGAIAVPLMRSLARLPLRQAIGTSTAVMTVASTVGAIAKNATMSSVVATGGSHIAAGSSLLIAAVLSPTALIGGILGARLTYALPLRAVRLAFVLLMVAASLRMTGVLG